VSAHYHGGFEGIFKGGPVQGLQAGIQRGDDNTGFSFLE
jgi:hypothetical protein